MAQLPRKAFTSRQVFNMARKRTIDWFSAQTFRDLDMIEERSRKVHCIIEIHDARLPISGRNLELMSNITNVGEKPHILVLNKRDLTDRCDHYQIKRQLAGTNLNKHILFTNCRNSQCTGVTRILPLATRLIMRWAKSSPHTSRLKEFNIMIAGIPHVGKRTIINRLRTRNQLQANDRRDFRRPLKLLVHHEPNIYLFEQPEVISPHIPDDETGMKLALVGTIPRAIVNDIELADYLLYWLNKHKQFGYVQKVGMQVPTDDIELLLSIIGQQEQFFKHVYRKKRRADDHMQDPRSAAKHFVKLYHNCELGAFNLDK